MMQKLVKAAIIVAVFLLFAQNGCYTRLKSIKPKLEPDPPAANPEWDFGNGWYWNDYPNNNIYYGYHHLQWWNDCTWLTNSHGKVDMSLETNLPKIDRRDSDAIPYITPSLSPVYSPSGLNLSGSQNEKADGQSDTAAPLVQKTDAQNNSGNDDSQNDTKKKRGR